MLIDNEPATALPAVALCRAAVDIDKAADALEKHIERCSGAAGIVDRAVQSTAGESPVSNVVKR